MLHRQIIIHGNVNELSRLAAWVESLGKELCLSQELNFHLDLILVEAISNIIFYAYDDPENHLIGIQVKKDSDLLVVTIEDDGCPFNPLECPDQAPPEILEEAPVGGLGILLIRRYAKTIAYSRNEGKNILTLTLQKENDLAQEIILAGE